MNRFAEIHGVLAHHKREIDKIVQEYRAKIQKQDKETYTESYLDKARLAAIAEAQAAVDVQQHQTAVRLNQIIADIQGELQVWVSSPANASQLQLINTLVASGLQLTLPELQSLQAAVSGSYFAARIIGQLAQTSGIEGIQVPDLGKYTDLLAAVKTQAELFVTAYCAHAPELLNDKDNPNITYLSYAADQCKCLGPDSAITMASLVWSGDCIPCSHKISLTADERESLALMFAGCASDASRANRARELVQQMPLMRDVLESQPGYRGLLDEPADAD